MNKWIMTGLLPLILLGCKPKDLEYLEVQNFKVGKIGLATSTVSLDVACYNPNHFGMTITELSSDVYANNEWLGKAVLDSAVRIPRLDTFLLPVKMEMNMGSTVNGLMKIFNRQNDSVPLLLRFEGNAKLKKGAIILNYPIRYEGMKTIKFGGK